MVVLNRTGIGFATVTGVDFCVGAKRVDSQGEIEGCEGGVGKAMLCCRSALALGLSAATLCTAVCGPATGAAAQSEPAAVPANFVSFLEGGRMPRRAASAAPTFDKAFVGFTCAN